MAPPMGTEGLSARQKVIAELRDHRTGYQDKLLQSSAVEKKRRAKQAADFKAKKQREKQAANNELRKFDAQVAKAMHGRGVPIMSSIKKIVDHLHRVEREVGLDEVQRELGVDVLQVPRLLDSLKSNPMVTVVEEGDLVILRYTAKHAVKGRDDLLELIRRSPDGINSSELADSYKKVAIDTFALVKEGLVLEVARPRTLATSGRDERYLFPWDPRFDVRVDADVVAAWHAVPIPEGADEFDAALKRAGIQPAFRRTVRKRASKEGKKRKKAKRKYDYRTNTHMKELEAKPPLQ